MSENTTLPLTPDVVKQLLQMLSHEASALQSSLADIQSQIQIDADRMTKISKICAQLGYPVRDQAINVGDRRNSQISTKTFSRYKYHDPIVDPVSVVTPPTTPTVTADQYQFSSLRRTGSKLPAMNELGIKWDSMDYVQPAKIGRSGRSSTTGDASHYKSKNLQLENTATLFPENKATETRK
ncbi:hypothetical protein BCR33DRAFT_787872 [Rhizoclosmatium globosum]|uniref:Uncharacterized protein n=1 Tax=Rhizoclosmatium globosum TaxID=329046 RepID=A0A1Y2BYP6_9FUNG|nr:hypothetical protein BCR33DRAFT_787872 [Rhizoclosmatium globosum]|eukprot:ORY39903.1 hypothetical protein BCR33DRAFT_787872 [Rhizoclosmatium globosum]